MKIQQHSFKLGSGMALRATTILLIVVAMEGSTGRLGPIPICRDIVTNIRTCIPLEWATLMATTTNAAATLKFSCIMRKVVARALLSRKECIRAHVLALRARPSNLSSLFVLAST